MIRRPSIIHYNRKRRIRRTKLIAAVYHTDIKRALMAENRLTQPATRETYMVIFADALPDEGLQAINNVPDNSIPDVPSTHTLASSIYKLYRAGILQGNDAAHSCNPKANIKRSEVAAILIRIMDETKRIKFDMGN